MDHYDVPGGKMKQAQSITYDKQADALYIQLREGRPAKAHTYTDDVILHLDGTGHPLGVEVLDLTTSDPTADLTRLVREYGLDPNLLDAIVKVRALAADATERVIVA